MVLKKPEVELLATKYKAVLDQKISEESQLIGKTTGETTPEEETLPLV